MTKLKCLDLFSGIGGFALGFDRAGIETAAFCEIEPYCRRVLAQHFPNRPIFNDVRSLTREQLDSAGISVDIICGGFPCQDISLAGHGAGLAGARSGLWYEYLRLIKEIKPKYVVAENVSALRSRGLEEVLRGLASVGYDAEWHCIPASSIGANHQRDRVWIIAYPHVAQREGGGVSSGIYQEHADARFGGWWQTEPAVGRVVDGLPSRLDKAVHTSRLHALGNSVVPQIPEIIGKVIVADWKINSQIPS